MLARGVVLSNTSMGQHSRGHCTNILVNPNTPEAWQARPRIPGNGNLYRNTLGDEASINTYWHVGRWVELELEEVPENQRRITHPEDRIFRGKTQIFKDVWNHTQLIEAVTDLTFDSIYDALPNISDGGWSGGSKRSTPPDLPNVRSVAYVRAKTFSMVNGKDATFTDLKDNKVVAPLKDDPLLEKFFTQGVQLKATHNPIIVRCALGSPWPDHSPRCWLMISWASIE